MASQLACDLADQIAAIAPISGVRFPMATDIGRFEGEHRNVAIGFVRFSGLDDLLTARGADAAAAALDQVVRSIQRAADEHGVTFLESDIDRSGGRIVLVSGAPQTAGGDEERLLRTLRFALDADPPLPLHVGASRGRVFTGQVERSSGAPTPSSATPPPSRHG